MELEPELAEAHVSRGHRRIADAQRSIEAEAAFENAMKLRAQDVRCCVLVWDGCFRPKAASRKRAKIFERASLSAPRRLPGPPIPRPGTERRSAERTRAEAQLRRQTAIDAGKSRAQPG